MASSSDNPLLPAPELGSGLPTLPIWVMFRLGLFQMGLGIMSLLTLGILNRIMIAELKIPALIVAGVIAVSLLVAPVRVWFGQLSDTRPLWGQHRTGYIWLGSLVFTITSFVIVQVIWQLDASILSEGWSLNSYGWVAILAGLFGVYGVALSAGSTPFAAMLVDMTEEAERSKLVSVVWSMLMVGIVAGAILSSRLLNAPEVCGAAVVNFDPTQTARTVNLPELQRAVNQLFVMIPALVLGLTVVATAGVERQYSRFAHRTATKDSAVATAQREDGITLGRALRILTANRQTGIFFVFLLMMTLALFMQDAVMEPYGGEVFGMCIAETTRLNAFFGIGTLLGLSTSGFWLVPRIGKPNTVRLGCWGAMLCIGFFIVSGFFQQSSLLMGSLLLFGLASGVLTAGATSLMLDLTAAETAGTFIGAWGLSQAWARAMATFAGGALLTTGRQLFGTPLAAYGLVFGVQALMACLALVFLSRLNVDEFRQNARQLLNQVLAGDLDG